MGKESRLRRVDAMIKRDMLYFQCVLKEVLKSAGKSVGKSGGCYHRIYIHAVVDAGCLAVDEIPTRRLLLSVAGFGTIACVMMSWTKVKVNSESAYGNATKR